MFDIGLQEMLVIGVLALLVFGPEKLPELGKKLGRAMREFRRASDEFRSTVESNLQIHEDILPAPSSYTDPGSSSGATSADSASGPEASGAPATASDPAPEPAAVAASEGPGEGAADGLPEEPYWTSRGGRLLHRRTCAWRRRVTTDAMVPIKALADGWDQGLQPCPVCDPREAAVTS